MAADINIVEESEKRYSRFDNFGEMLFWSYANLQMLCAALNMGKMEYDRRCYMIRAKAFKAYKEGRWNIHDLMEFNVAKIKNNNYCWYCGKEMEPSKLTKDHVFPRCKGGVDDMDNIIMVCKTCNSSKGKMDLFEWYEEVRQEWPPINVWVHYLKNIYLYSLDNSLMDKRLEELDALNLPFNWRYIPLDYPQPEIYL
ncbi:MAG: HNH endonuclease [Bacteroidaceae bacterium]|nr:HNH endonuclease [Bacteroidaceae bacterium]